MNAPPCYRCGHREDQHDQELFELARTIQRPTRSEHARALLRRIAASRGLDLSRKRQADAAIGELVCAMLAADQYNLVRLASQLRARLDAGLAVLAANGCECTSAAILTDCARCLGCRVQDALRSGGAS